MREILRLDKLTVGYDDRAIVSDIDLTIGEGEILSIVGPNGAGKSTLLKTIEGAIEPISGYITLQGRHISEYTSIEKAKQIALVHTGGIRTEHLSGYEAVALGRFPYTGSLGILNPEDERVVDEAIEAVGAGDFASQDITSLSDGQRQRIRIARAIAQEPRLMLLDEPTSFLDIKAKAETLSLIRRLANEKGIAIIMSIHDIDLARKISDLALAIDADHKADFSSAEEILKEDYIRKLFSLTDELSQMI